MCVVSIEGPPLARGILGVRDLGGGFYRVLTVPLSVSMGMSPVSRASAKEPCGLALGRVVAPALSKNLLETRFLIP